MCAWCINLALCAIVCHGIHEDADTHLADIAPPFPSFCCGLETQVSDLCCPFWCAVPAEPTQGHEPTYVTPPDRLLIEPQWVPPRFHTMSFGDGQHLKRKELLAEAPTWNSSEVWIVQAPKISTNQESQTPWIQNSKSFHPLPTKHPFAQSMVQHSKETGLAVGSYEEQHLGRKFRRPAPEIVTENAGEGTRRQDEGKTGAHVEDCVGFSSSSLRLDGGLDNRARRANEKDELE
ncbi:hypothetical protein C8R45DRAFT_941851 [Mycena sanguinolenta]|nr:hypothetical protein C8R45DRAFT_941851 [Mycena sanguinolenta]